MPTAEDGPPAAGLRGTEPGSVGAVTPEEHPGATAPDDGPGPVVPRPPLPPAFGLALDPSTRLHDDGRLLIGGSPRRIMRLSESGAAALQALTADARRGPAPFTRPSAVAASSGAPASTRGAAPPAPGSAARTRARPASPAGAGVLARRLVDAVVVHPVPPAGAGVAAVADVTIVIPVRDRPVELARCLGALRGHPHVLVVDDGSTDPGAVRSAADAVGARTLRRPVPGGPAVARNAALAVVETPLVAFLDSDCVPPRGWLAPLVAHLEDPAVGVVAPRVRGLVSGTSAAARWGLARSPLDLGVRPARIAPGSTVAYAPTAALVVRRAAVAGGFDPALRYGEDVDLVWRLHDAGWSLRYEPAVVVDHEEPASWPTFLARRCRYGTSAGPLARRHGRRLAPVVLAPWPTVAAALLLGRRPRAAIAVVALDAVRTHRRLRAPGVPASTGARVVVRGAAQTLDGLARTGAMLAPAPLLGLAAARRRARLPVLGLLLGAPLIRWAEARRDGRTGGLDPLRWTAASMADDAAYGAGVWSGAVRARAPWALRPAIAGTGRTAAAPPRPPAARGPAAPPGSSASVGPPAPTPSAVKPAGVAPRWQGFS